MVLLLLSEEFLTFSDNQFQNHVNLISFDRNMKYGLEIDAIVQQQLHFRGMGL